MTLVSTAKIMIWLISSLVVILVSCGLLFAFRLNFRRQILTLSLTILFSSLTQLEVYELVDLLCSLFGLLTFGSCRMNKTLVCSTTQQVPCNNIRWIKSKCSLLGGWRRRMLLLLQIIIVGGRTHCFIWVSTNVFCILMFRLFWYLCNSI
jgi:hypothetical protein